mgnify:CR=1 FL=1
MNTVMIREWFELLVLDIQILREDLIVAFLDFRERRRHS